MLGDAYGAGIVYHFTKQDLAQSDAEHARKAAELLNDGAAHLGGSGEKRHSIDRRSEGFG